jgi:hypothetical protein
MYDLCSVQPRDNPITRREYSAFGVLAAREAAGLRSLPETVVVTARQGLGVTGCGGCAGTYWWVASMSAPLGTWR